MKSSATSLLGSEANAALLVCCYQAFKRYFPHTFFFLVQPERKLSLTTNLSVVAAFRYKETLHLK